MDDDHDQQAADDSHQPGPDAYGDEGGLQDDMGEGMHSEEMMGGQEGLEQLSPEEQQQMELAMQHQQEMTT